MTKHHDPIQDCDLQAYIDDQLTAQRRIEVEAHLSAKPDAAARMMADLRVRDELRLALSADGDDVPRIQTRAAARRLEQALQQRGRSVVLRRVASVILLIGAGWVGHAVISPFGASPVVASVPTPAFVREALQAHDATLLRESLHPQQAADASAKPATAQFDAKDIRAATGIVMPQLPGGWSVADSQIFPSDFGPSVEMAVKPKRGAEVTLFAARTGSFAVQNVTLAQADGAKAAYWQIGEVAYALVSKERPADELQDAANQLARSLY